MPSLLEHAIPYVIIGHARTANILVHLDLNRLKALRGLLKHLPGKQLHQGSPASGSPDSTVSTKIPSSHSRRMISPITCTTSSSLCSLVNSCSNPKQYTPSNEPSLKGRRRASAATSSVPAPRSDLTCCATRNPLKAASVPMTDRP